MIELRCRAPAFARVVNRAGFGEASPKPLRGVGGHNQHEAVQEFGDRALFVREAPPAYVIDSVRTEFLVPGARST